VKKFVLVRVRLRGVVVAAEVRPAGLSEGCDHCICTESDEDGICDRCHGSHPPRPNGKCNYCTDEKGNPREPCFICGNRLHKTEAHECKYCGGFHKTFEHIHPCGKCGLPLEESFGQVQSYLVRFKFR